MKLYADSRCSSEAELHECDPAATNYGIVSGFVDMHSTWLDLKETLPCVSVHCSNPSRCSHTVTKSEELQPILSAMEIMLPKDPTVSDLWILGVETVMKQWPMSAILVRVAGLGIYKYFILILFMFYRIYIRLYY